MNTKQEEKSYQHHKNKALYHIISDVKLKVNGVWHAGILYAQNDKPDAQYVRTAEDFHASFSLYTKKDTK